MAWIILTTSIALFIIGIISPHMAGKIQYKTDKEAGWLKRMSDWLWDPITWWIKGTVEMSRKVLKTVAQWGKKTRRKLPF